MPTTDPVVKESMDFSSSVHEPSWTRFGFLLARKHALISAYDGYVSRSETPTRPHSAPSTPIVRLIYVFSRVIRPHLGQPSSKGSVVMATTSVPTPNRGAPTMSASALRSRGKTIIIDGEQRRREKTEGWTEGRMVVEEGRTWNRVGGGFRSFFTAMGRAKSAPSRFLLLSGLPSKVGFHLVG